MRVLWRLLGHALTRAGWWNGVKLDEDYWNKRYRQGEGVRDKGLERRAVGWWIQSIDRGLEGQS